MKFCPECKFILYHIIDKDDSNNDKLFNNCNNCGYRELSNDMSIYKVNYKIENKNTINKYSIYDNTFPRTIHHKCPNNQCESNKDESLREAIYTASNTSLKITYICTICKTEWKYN